MIYCLASLVFYLFTPTRLIHSINHYHPSKILYLPFSKSVKELVVKVILKHFPVILINPVVIALVSVDIDIVVMV